MRCHVFVHPSTKVLRQSSINEEEEGESEDEKKEEEEEEGKQKEEEGAESIAQNSFQPLPLTQGCLLCERNNKSVVQSLYSLLLRKKTL